MQVFYLPHLQPEHPTAIFDADESKHISKVLRKKMGDVIHITNGLGALFQARLDIISDKKCTALVEQCTLVPADPFRVHLAIAPTKMMERLEWLVEKATEIGVHEFSWIYCDHSERQVLKLARLEKIAQAAVKQSVRAWAPVVHEPVSFSQFVKQPLQGQGYIAHCAEGEKAFLMHAVEPHTTVTVLIGPEGDFSAREIAMAQQAGYQAVHLGPQRLRTETAALAAAYQVVLKNGS